MPLLFQTQLSDPPKSSLRKEPCESFISERFAAMFDLKLAYVWLELFRVRLIMPKYVRFSPLNVHETETLY